MLEKYSILITAIIVIILTFCLMGCTVTDKRIYPEINIGIKTKLDNSIPLLNRTDDSLLDNPDRGFRLELYITLGRNVAYPSVNDSAEDAFYKELAIYKDDKPTLAQVYVYLCDYNSKLLDKNALEQLKNYFKLLKANNIKMLLRFAYEYSTDDFNGPQTYMIINHTNQLKSFFIENSQLLDSTLFAMQLGVIGLWGEGHTSKYKHNLSRVIGAVFDMTPEKYDVQIRTQDLMKKVPTKYLSRAGFHDDFLVGEKNDWSYINPTDKNYKEFCAKSQVSINDAEMPWGNYKDLNNGELNHLGILKQSKDFCLTSLSIRHNYKEDKDNTGSTETYNLERYKDIYLSVEEIRSFGYPINDNLHPDSRVNVFEYLQYYLGYQLVGSNLNVETSGENDTISLLITNFGLAAPHTINKLELVITDKNYNIINTISTSFNPLDLITYGQKVYSFVAPRLSSEQKVGIKLSNNSGQGIKLANDIIFKDGINFIL